MIKNWTGSYRNAILSAFFIFSILFCIISHYMIQNVLDNITARANKKFQIVENFVTLSIKQANHIIYGLSLTLATETIDATNKNIFNLIKSFDHKMERYRSIPFYGFKVISPDDIVILHTLIPDKLFTPERMQYDLELIKKAKNKPFELQAGAIRIGSRNKEEIIPFCMSINNNKTYIGSICSGLLVKTLSAQLHHHIKDKNIDNVELITLRSEDNLNRINNSFTFANIIKGALKGEPLTVYQPLTSYPVLLKAEINCYYLSREIGKVIFLCACYFAIFVLFTYTILVINEKFYDKPFSKIQKKLNKHSNIFADKMAEFHHPAQKCCLNSLANTINYMIDYCAALHLAVEKTALEKPAAELRNNILHLILNEYHYHKSRKSDIEPGTLYFNELEGLITSKEQNINLKWFLENLVNYCSEYYSELKIKLVIENEYCKDFTSKHAALTEAIFCIFTSITRMGKLSTDDVITLKASFHNSELPSISIETLICDSSMQPLGWESGPSYTCTGLLATHLLAKEINFFFSIEQQSNKIIFSLQPFDSEKLKNTNELCMKLPLNLAWTNK